MELCFFSFSMLILLVLVLSISLYYLKLIIWKPKPADINGTGKLLPPGGTGWPIIGEGLEFLIAGLNGVPEKFFYDRMQKYSTSKIFRTSLLGEAVYVLCGAAGNKFLFSNEYKLVSAWWPPSILKVFPVSSQFATEQASKKLRKTLYPQFLKLEVIQRNIGIMDSMARQQFETLWGNKEEVTVYPMAKNYTFSLACRLFLSVDDQAQVDELLKPFTTVADGFISMPIDLPGTPFNRAIKASKLVRKKLITIIKQRMDQIQKDSSSSPTPQDMLSHLILFSDDDDGESGSKLMNETYIADLVLPLMIAGHDTTTSVITVVTKYLAELPHVYNEVLREQNEIAKSKAPGELLNWDDIQKMRYSWNVVCETMRLAPPVQGAFKQSLSDFTYAGYFIPKGWKLYWSAISTHKNPEYFPDPEKFDPSRFDGKGPAPYTFVPFGGGPGTCPGKEFGRSQILVFLHHLVRSYKWEKLLPAQEKLIFNPFPFPIKGLPIRLHPQPH